MKKNQQGFTLIELIIVIVILGILAVTASPKFLDLQGDAKASTVQGLSASLKSASNIVYSKALVQGKANAASSATTNPAIAVVYGYPAANTMAAILDITQVAATPDEITDESVDWEVATVTADKKSRIYPAGSYDGATSAFSDDTACYVEYTEAFVATGQTEVTPAAVTLATTGC
ncbi:hypothetical protein GCM10009128_13240 [Psychrosphaera haliotis]|uniref:prepilin-type N-terminal cleavage/methylation domain-containing protein n=1 Tax=Psychrosphaera haliotis TaxID=555083 RepID=UPI0031CDC6F0